MRSGRESHDFRKIGNEISHFEVLVFEVCHRGGLCMHKDNKQQLAGWKGYEIQRQNFVVEHGVNCVTQ